MADTQSADGTMMSRDPLSMRDAAIALMRTALGVVFIVASIGKINDPNAFATSISAYRIITGDAALVIATILPWVELLSGLGLLLGIFWRGSALLALSMLVVFTIVVASAHWRGLDISCGCYTQDPSAERLGWWKIGENSLLAIIALLVLRRQQSRFTLQQRFAHFRRRLTPEV
jgi:putative oxidoreductase